jgi:hypothetical protein
MHIPIREEHAKEMDHNIQCRGIGAEENPNMGR